ncbi:hypothetical protein [Hoeflea sp. EC-HK425]|uniref:hypothetical protein n=1 Tax=Hoeflea sp. EC-HK425 TaxID=2038388 RepID=UPI00125C9F9B|nr:hypothetical protein [Hoeflea sp. EC-HK425]VVT17939.1 conserved membrane hypothetical protein [Hoeflea sp. EC-HK425]|tara:strand:- start:95 stop:670 length:576 start_codon:yes stop_codon:yes gene_type:complete
MSDAVIACGVVAVAVLGFAPQNNAMLTAGAERTFKPVIDGMISSICGWLSLFALALGVLHLMPQWMSGTAMVLASLLLALSGLTRYMADPGTPLEQEAAPVRPTLPVQNLQSPESWAVAFFLAGSALSGSVTLASAFAGLTLLTASGLGLWAVAGWSGCLYLSSGWHRRHFDWGFGILMFVAAIAALMPGG